MIRRRMQIDDENMIMSFKECRHGNTADCTICEIERGYHILISKAYLGAPIPQPKGANYKYRDIVVTSKGDVFIVWEAPTV